MLSLLDRPDRRGLAASLALCLALVALANGVIFALGWDGNRENAPPFLPPSIVIAIVWVALFVCMAFARWEMNRAVVTRRQKVELIVEAANVGLLILAISVGGRAIRTAWRVAAWLAPLALWLGFASVAGAFALASAN
jgi:tryptophan-rich sensory protein